MSQIGDEWDVRHVQPYEAVKAYLCPGCNGEIPRGLGHEVVVPRDAPDLRRHWHTGCWFKEQQRRARGEAPRRY
jgi:hypothetical protein